MAITFKLIAGLTDRKTNLRIVADKMLEELIRHVDVRVGLDMYADGREGAFVSVVVSVVVVGNCSISYGNTSAAYATSVIASTSLDYRADINSLDTKVYGYVNESTVDYFEFLLFSKYWFAISYSVWHITPSFCVFPNYRS